MKKMDRRNFVKGLGVTLWLPYLESLSVFTSSQAFAQSMGQKKRFLALAWPQGAAGENGNIGKWHFESGGYLGSLADIRSNIIIPRGFGGGDVAGGWGSSATIHGNGYSMLTTGYSIKGQRSLLNAPASSKSIDQIIGDQVRATNADIPLHSFITGVTLENGGLGQVHGDSGKTISWQGPFSPVLPIIDMRAMFDKLYGVSNEAQANNQKEKSRKKSILDFVKSDLSSLKAKVNSDDSKKLDEYLTQVRDIEKFIDSNVVKTCDNLNSFPFLTANLADFDNCIAFLRRSIDLHLIAHKCDLVRSSTITMDTSVSNIGSGIGDSYHVHFLADLNARYDNIIKAHVDTIGYAIRKFKEAGLLDETVIYAGSDASLGHANVNAPFIIAGSGSGFRWGQEVGNVNYLRPTGDLLIDILKSFGINRSTIGNTVSWDIVRPSYPYSVANTKTTATGNSGILV